MFSVQWIRQQALAVGFDDCGVALAERLDEDAAFMDRWVAQGLHGNMSYLERNREKRYDPRELVPGATAVVVCVLRYDKCRRDYHRTIKSMLYELDARLHGVPAMPAAPATPSDPSAPSATVPSATSAPFTPSASPSSSDNASSLPSPAQALSPLPQHLFCDSAPFLERRWAVKAGLGFIGRNHQFFHHTLGSMVHLGEIVIDKPIEDIEKGETIITRIPSNSTPPPTAATPSRFADTPCADCHLCEEACPTGALRNPVWDATRCIAYTTHRCLVCQQACPLNRPL